MHALVNEIIRTNADVRFIRTNSFYNSIHSFAYTSTNAETAKATATRVGLC